MTQALTVQQLERLHSDLHPSRVAKRAQGDRDLSYLEAYDVRATLIRLFGYAGFSAETIETRIVHESQYSAPNNPERLLWRIAVICTFRLTIHQTGAIYTESAAASQSGPDFGEVLDFAVKGLALDTPLPTPTGWTTMQDVQVGDTVIDMDGKPARVHTKSAIKELPCYRVTFGDGQQIVCDSEHYWWAYNGASTSLRAHNIEELYERKRAGSAITIPVAGAASLPDVDLPIDPYVLGYWLGDGDSASGRITVGTQDREETIALLQAAGAEIGSVTFDKRNGVAALRVGSSRAGSRTGLTTVLRETNLLGHKHIPDVYLRASIPQRLALLQGLMDSDGTVSHGRPDFTATDKALALQVAELVRSLGDRVSFTETPTTGFGVTTTAYRVTWTPSMVPFRLRRKADKVRLRTKRGAHRVVSIEKIDSVPTQCIGVDSPTKSYLAGDSMVPTHNTAESDALKRAATNLGTQLGLSLYKSGSTQDVVSRVFAPDQHEIIEDLRKARAGGEDATAARERMQSRLKTHEATPEVTDPTQVETPEAATVTSNGPAAEPTVPAEPAAEPAEPVSDTGPVDHMAKAAQDLEKVTAGRTAARRPRASRAGNLTAVS